MIWGKKKKSTTVICMLWAAVTTCFPSLFYSMNNTQKLLAHQCLKSFTILLCRKINLLSSFFVYLLCTKSFSQFFNPGRHGKWLHSCFMECGSQQTDLVCHTHIWFTNTYVSTQVAVLFLKGFILNLATWTMCGSSVT